MARDSFFDYTIQGVHLTDGRGGWNLQPDTSILPRFPGANVTRYNIPGGQGERQVQHAPIVPATYTFKIRFFPIDIRLNSNYFGRFGQNWEERVWLLERNINEFMYHTRLGAQSHLGNVKLTRELDPGFRYTRHNWEGRIVSSPEGDSWRGISYDRNGFNWGRMSTVGRVISSTEVEFDPDALFADYTFIFENPTGTWWSRWRYMSDPVQTRQANRTYGFQVRTGTAPCDDALIAIRPRNANMVTGGLRVRNEHGVGFQMRGRMNTGRWYIFDTYNWAVGSHLVTEHQGINWQVAKPDRTSMVEVGRPTGSALTIIPGPENRDPIDGLPRGRIRVRAPGDFRIVIAHRQKWF